MGQFCVTVSCHECVPECKHDNKSSEVDNNFLRANLEAVTHGTVQRVVGAGRKERAGARVSR